MYTLKTNQLCGHLYVPQAVPQSSQAVVWLGKCLLLWAHTHRRYFNSKTFPQWKAWLPSRREVVGQTLNDVAKNTKEPMGAMISHTIYGMCQTASTQVATTFSPYQILSTREESFLVNILTLSN